MKEITTPTFFKTFAQTKKPLNQFSEDELTSLTEKYKDNIFYTVGYPLQIVDLKKSTDKTIRHRKTIPNEEIAASFPENEQVLRLFKSEFEALEYARSLRESNRTTDDIRSMKQPAIFSVILPKSTKKLISINEVLTINPHQHVIYFADPSKKPDDEERQTSISYFEVSRMNIIPLKANVKIHTWVVGEYSNHGEVYYQGLKIKPEEHRNQCVMC